MGISDSEAQRLAEEIAASMGIKTKRRRRLVAVPPQGMPEDSGMTALQRDALYARIRDIAQLYGLGWLVRQECMHVNGIMECLPDDDLVALLGKMDRGVEALMDGVPFAEVGLVRGATCNWVA
jgi:hypothetical protein